MHLTITSHTIYILLRILFCFSKDSNIQHYNISIVYVLVATFLCLSNDIILIYNSRVDMWIKHLQYI